MGRKAVFENRKKVHNYAHINLGENVLGVGQNTIKMRYNATGVAENVFDI